MADVLGVATLEFCHPVAFRIGVEAHDSPPHASSGVMYSASVPNDWRISCGPSSSRPHKPTFLSTLTEGAARTESGGGPARRLHAEPV